MEVLTEVDEARIATLLERERVLLARPPRARRARRSRSVGELLGLHPMAMEDTREFGQRPKVDVYESHVLVVFYTARRTGEDEPVAVPIEVHVYVSGDFVVTVRQEACDLLDELHDALIPEDTEAEDYLVYRIFDSLTDAWYPVINAIETHVDGLEAEVFVRARREQLSRIYRLRQEVREHHRLVSEQRDHFQPAAEAIRNLAGLTRGSKEYLRDVGDHLAQVSGELHRQYEDLMSLAQTYFNANADRLNQHGDAADRGRHALRHLDADHRLLRPELRLARPARRERARLPDLRHRRPRACPRSCSGRCSGSSAATGSEAWIDPPSVASRNPH